MKPLLQISICFVSMAVFTACGLCRQGSLPAPVPPAKEINCIGNPSGKTLDATSGKPLFWAPITTGEGSASFSGGLLTLESQAAIPPNKMLAWSQYDLQKNLSDCGPGTEMQFSLRANTGGNPSTKFRFYVEMAQGDKFIGTFASEPESIYVGWESKSLKFTMPAQKPTQVYVIVQLLTPGKLMFDEVQLVKSPAAPAGEKYADPAMAVRRADDRCLTTNFPPRHTYVLPDKPRDLAVDYFLPSSTLTISLRSIGGAEIKRYDFTALPVRQPGRLTVTLPDLPAGSYQLTYQSPAKEETLTETEFFRIRSQPTRGVEFTAKHRMRLNGIPFFPIGLTTSFAWREFASFKQSEDPLRIYAQSGINFLCIQDCTADVASAEFVNQMADKYGFAVCNWNSMGDLKGRGDEVEKLLLNNAENAKLIRNFVGFLDDESMWRQIPLEQLRRNYRTFFKDAPDYLVWQNFAPRITGTASQTQESNDNAIRYSRMCDVTGLDIYPVPEGNPHSNLANRNLNCVGEYTDLIKTIVADQKPVWMILQRFGWSDMQGALTAENPRPNYEQSRFMVYNALTHGASGIIWHAEGGSIFDLYSPYWATLADVNLELKAVTEVWKTGTDSLEKSPFSDVRVMRIQNDRDLVVVVVNEGKAVRNVRLSLAHAPETMYELPLGKAQSPRELVLQANEVRILSSRKIVIPKTPVFQPGNGMKNVSVLLDAEWTAHPKLKETPDCTTFLKQSFFLTEPPSTQATIRIAGDDSWEIYMNGRLAGAGCGYKKVHEMAIYPFLKTGDNLLEIKLYNISGPSGVVFELTSGDTTVRSGKASEFSDKIKKNWVKAELLGKMPVAPWGAPELLLTNGKKK